MRGDDDTGVAVKGNHAWTSRGKDPDRMILNAMDCVGMAEKVDGRNAKLVFDGGKCEFYVAGSGPRKRRRS